jgi:hypothetical protein
MVNAARRSACTDAPVLTIDRYWQSWSEVMFTNNLIGCTVYVLTELSGR